MRLYIRRAIICYELRHGRRYAVLIGPGGRCGTGAGTILPIAGGRL
jgi:hypothetical protein